MQTITVQKLDPPKSEKGPWGLQDTNGKWWKIFGREKNASAVEEGATFEIETKPNEYQGKTTYVITKATKTAGPGRAIQPPKNDYQRSRNPRETEQIFVLALVKSFIEAGHVPLTVLDTVEAFKVARDVYRQTYAAQNNQAREDLDDHVPF